MQSWTFIYKIGNRTKSSRYYADSIEEARSKFDSVRSDRSHLLQVIDN